jgi:type I restriction enzyme R subunit
VAVREFPLRRGAGVVAYLLYVDGRTVGVLEAKKVGATLTGVETQSGRYVEARPADVPAYRRPLPFA